MTKNPFLPQAVAIVKPTELMGDEVKPIISVKDVNDFIDLDDWLAMWPKGVGIDDLVEALVSTPLLPEAVIISKVTGITNKYVRNKTIKAYIRLKFTNTHEHKKLLKQLDKEQDLLHARPDGIFLMRISWSTPRGLRLLKIPKEAVDWLAFKNIIFPA
jgi:hypothetical protein